MTSGYVPGGGDDGCIICGDTPTEGAHVKAKEAFEKEETARGYDRDFNIVRLCPSHHRKLDDGQIALCDCHEEAFVRHLDGSTSRVVLSPSILAKPEYLLWRNERSHIALESVDRACRS